MTTYLDGIVAAHRTAAAADTRPLDSLFGEARSLRPARGFTQALQDVARDEGVAVIAEIKRRSPSKGVLNPDLDPAEVATAYERGGAACLSVLTDEAHFGGSAADLRAARSATSIPVLRKDFTVCEADVADARLMGADAVLLIAAALDDGDLRRFHHLAIDVGLDALVEVHDEAEVERALEVGATLVGVNQRDLYTFEVDIDRAVRVSSAIPTEVVRVAESGIRGGDDAKRLADAGYHGLLVGESLVTSGDQEAGVRALRAAVRAIRQ